MLHTPDRHTLAALLASSALVLSACALETPLPTRSISSPVLAPAFTLAPAAEPSQTAYVSTLSPPTELPPERLPPVQLPFRGWTLSADGVVFALDAAGRVHCLSADRLEPLSASAPLYEGRDPGPSYLAADADHLFVSSPAVTQTLGLTREDYERAIVLDQAGPLAIDPGRRLFLVALVERSLSAYDLTNPSSLPTLLAESPLGSFNPLPTGVASDPAGRLLLVTLRDVSASPPHQREAYAAFDLDTLSRGEAFESRLGVLSRPSFASLAGRVVGTLAAKNGFLGSQLLVFDRNAQSLSAAGPLDGLPVVDPSGEWIYLLRERGLWMLRGSDLSLAAIEPFPGDPPSDVALSPDGKLLYLFADDGFTVRLASEVREGGNGDMAGPLPLQWMSPDQQNYLRGRFYAAPGDAATAFVQVGGYGETYRTTDSGRTWRFLAALTYPKFRYAGYLSLSPDFPDDRTLVALAPGSMQAFRSTDAGDTWQEWTPPVALTSDRDGNREIYAVDRPQAGGTVSGLQRRTADPGADENPAWSPAWTLLAFQSDRGGNWNIFTIRADCDPSGKGGDASCNLRQLTDDPADDMLPAWSPDGRSIAFVSTRDGNPEIYVMDMDGGRQRRLTDDPGGDWRPAWLPDSRALLFVSDRAGGNDIYRLEVPEETTARLPVPTTVIASSADERDPGVARDYVVFLSNAEGSMRTYRVYPPYDVASAFGVTPALHDEAHPSPLDDPVGATLVSLPEADPPGIYVATLSDYIPFVAGAGFNGHPAAGPVQWLPDADWSLRQLLLFESEGTSRLDGMAADPS